LTRSGGIQPGALISVPDTFDEVSKAWSSRREILALNSSHRSKSAGQLGNRRMIERKRIPGEIQGISSCSARDL
jgi:hypothetical protein